MELGLINLSIEIEEFRHSSRLRNIELENMREECLYRKNIQNLEHQKRQYFQNLQNNSYKTQFQP